MLRHAVVKGARLSETDARRVLQHLADLWSYDVSLVEVDAANNVLKEYVVSPRALASGGVGRLCGDPKPGYSFRPIATLP